jgi:hypothetical protein
MLVHFYNEQNVYIGSRDAYQDPEELKRGRIVYLIPDSATDIPPLPIVTGKDVVFDGSKWNYVDRDPGILPPQPTPEDMVVAHTAEMLAATDRDVPRSVEDLYDILLAKNVIKADDIPLKLSEKLDQKKRLRDELRSLLSTINSDVSTTGAEGSSF